MTTKLMLFDVDCPIFDNLAAVSTKARRGDQIEPCRKTFRLDLASPTIWPDEATMSAHCWSY